MPSPVDFSPQRPDELAELEALASALLLEQGAAALEPDELIELSRLLAEPCDQLWWLGRRIAALGDQPDAARALAERAQERAVALGGLADDCAADWPRWLAAPEIKPPPRLSDVLDPAELRERLEQARREPALLADLSEFEKFALLARGADETLLIDRRSAPLWDMPRQAVTRLVQSPRPPGFSDLRSLEQSLADAFSRWRAQGGTGFDAEGATLATIPFQVAAALLDRALGLDSEDVAAARLEHPIPYLATPAAWRQKAESLETAGLRSWAALAHVLAAGRSAGEAPDADAAAAARRLWADVRAVNDTLWPLLDSSPDGWLTRLNSPDRLVVPGAMPLAAAFRAADRQARRRYEEQILSLTAGGRDVNDEATADRLLQLIQQAKAADLALDSASFKPLDMPGLRGALGCARNNDIFLFVEIVRLQEVEPQPPGAVYCGVAIYQTEYKGATAQQYVDRCRAKIVGWKTSPRGVVEEALRDGPPPLESLRDARILIAPDGPLPADWFPYEHEMLLPSARWRTDVAPGWVVYTPSAGALAGGPWTLEQSLRAWYRSAFRHGTGMPYLRADGFQAGDRPGRPLEPNTLGMTLHRLHLDDVQGPTTLKELLDRKLQQQLPVIPFWVSQSRP